MGLADGWRPVPLVRLWGYEKYREATIVSPHATVEEADAALDGIAEKHTRTTPLMTPLRST